MLIWLAFVLAADWAQFRGPGASGIAEGPAPVELKNPLWSVEVPPGHSSPSIWRDHLVVTGSIEKTFSVIDLDRSTGKIRWKREIHADAIEPLQDANRAATATAAIDGERVYVYFGSAGLFAFGLDGKPAWSIPMSGANIRYGNGTSPIVAGDAVILSRFDEKDAFLLAVDRRTGKQLWRSSLGEEREWQGYSTPVVWKDQLIVHQGRSVHGYSLKDGSAVWSAKVSSEGTGTPAIMGDMLYVGASFRDEELRDPVPDWKTMLEKYDRDGDGLLSKEEFPADLAMMRRMDAGSTRGAVVTYKMFFDQNVDQNHDGKVSREEWARIEAQAKAPIALPHGILAIRLGGLGNVTESHIAWSEPRGAPEVPALVVYRDRLFGVTNGGILTVLEASTGRLIYRSRVGAGGMYYSSPVVAGGRVYVASEEGVVTVIDASAAELKVVGRTELGEGMFATPAVVDGKIYLRSAKRVLAFGN